jgi:hypothetical protein
MQKIIFALVLCAFAAFSACKNSALDTRSEKVVAFIGFNYKDSSYVKRSNHADSLHIVTLQHYIERINAHDEPEQYPVKLRLETFFCNFKADTTPLIYKQIEANPDIVLVVDNTWGRYIRNADSLIRDRIPVVSMVADQNRRNFGKNAIFLQPNDPQPNFLVQYVSKVLDAKRIGFVTECDYQLHERFMESIFKEKLPYEWVCLWEKGNKRNSEVPRDSVVVMRRNLRKLLSQPEPSVILLNTHTGYGDSIMRFLETAEFRNKTFVGVTTSLPDAELEKISQEKNHTFIRLEPGDEALPIEVYRDKEFIKEKFPNPFLKKGEENDKERIEKDKSAENSVRRCFDAMNILEAALLAGCKDRSSLLAYFKNLADRKVSIYNELYAFDSLLILKKEPNFEQVREGRTRSCSIQINTDGDTIPNLRVGIDVIDINDIDVRKNTFDCNLLYWVIVDSNHLAKEGYIDFANVNSPAESRYQIAEERMGKNVMRLYRISGQFLGNFESFDFPFDAHEIKIPVTALSSSNKIKISFDYSRLQLRDKIKDFQLNDWDTEEYFVTLDNQLNNAIGSLDKVTFDPADKDKYLEKYKNLTVHLKVKRQPWGAIILIIMPFLMFSALPIFMVFFHKASFEEVGELIITSFLATVAYSINLVQISPATDSMNLAYVFLMMTLGINFFCFIYVTYIDRSRKRSSAASGANGKRKVFNLSGRIWIPYLLLILLLMLFYLVFRG